MLRSRNWSSSLTAMAMSFFGMQAYAVTAPILDPYGTSLTAHPPIASNETGNVNVGPRFDQRATDIDGTLRSSSPLGWAIAADRIGGGYASGRMLGDVNLATGSYHPTEVDLALPTLGLPVVIGRTYNLLQQNTGTRGDVINAQGWNWSQTAQPQIAMVPGSTSDLDVLYLVFGADRFIEFKRTGTSASEFKSKNGAAGAVQFTAGSGTVPELYTYHDPSGNRITFFGFNTAAGDAKGQLWKMADAQGHVAYAHDESSAATAAGGYTEGLVQTMYDESGRRYVFTYATVSEYTMLVGVQAQINTGSWTTVAQVDYVYYEEEEAGKGLAGDLKLVTITHKGVSGGDYVRRKYYRYYTGEWADAAGSRGREHALKFVVGFDGVRQYDASGTSFFSATDTALRPYAEAYFEYSSASDYRLKAVTFNGECGCGSGSSGEYALAYANASSYSTMIGNTAYDNAWARRTVVTQPDGNHVSQYFDETGAVLSRVLSSYEPSSSPGTSDKKWVTGIVRNSSGQVTAVHSPANITGYTHSTGSITTSTSAGLVTYFTRFASSGNLDGLRSGVTIREGTSGSDTTLSTITASDRQMLIGSTGAISIAQIDSSSTYPAGSALTTSYSYTYWSTTNTDQSYLSAKSIQTTNPTVSTTKNGSGSATTSTRYLRKDGTAAFSKDAGEIVSYMGRSAFGQVDTQIADCNPSTIADIKDEDKASGANLWGVSSLAGTPIHAKTTMTYDDQGRLTSSTQPSYGTSGSTTRTSVNVYVLDSARLGTMSFPRKVSSTYYGPASYTRVNHAGKVDRQTTIQITSSGTTTVPGTTPSSTDWSGMVDQVYDLTGMRHSETRTYTTGTSTYDTASKHYDNMGRLARTVDVTGTIRRTVFDARGLPTERWIGTDDSSWTNPDGSGSAANMVATEIMEYDDGYGDRNGHLTTRIQDPDGNWTGTLDQRVTTIKYDFRSRAIVQLNPVPPHSVTKYDNSNRVIAVAQYKETTGLAITTDPTATSASTRVALNESAYDERGQVYRTTRHEIVQTGTSAGNKGLNLLADQWYDASGRVIKSHGPQITKTAYDRLGRVTDQFIIAKLTDSSYADADDVANDVVMEQTHVALDPATGRALAQWLVQRAHDDYTDGTLGALDTNADGDTRKLTSTNLPANARPQITAMWFDDLDRVTDTVRYGTNGGSTFDRTGLSIPSSSSTTLKTTTTYDDFGRVWKVTDPAGVESRTTYDFAGRRSVQIDNYVNGTPGDTGNDDDRKMSYTYTSGRLTSMKRWMPSSSDDQETTYEYNTGPYGVSATSIVKRADIQTRIIYPEQTSGQTAANRDVVFIYNALSEVTAKIDPAGNEITTTYDKGGRVATREATNVEDGFESAVVKIETTYSPRGMVETVKQRDVSDYVLDEVAFAYDGWGNLESSTQDPDSEISGSGRDAYTSTWTWSKNTVSNGWRNLYLAEWSQPDGSTGAVFTPTFSATGAEPNHFMKRTLRITDDTTEIADYVYLGVSTVIGSYQPETQMKNAFRFTEGNSSTYNTYMDRFNRPIKQLWRRDISGTVDPKVVDWDLAYDLAGNEVTLQDNVLLDANSKRHFDRIDSFDALRRMTKREEGKVVSSAIASGDRSRLENTTRNLAGRISTDQVNLNWSSTDTDFIDPPPAIDAGEMNDARTYNKRNELVSRTYNDSDNPTTPKAVYPLYDKNGNMISDGEAHTYKYNVWCQLSEIRLGLTELATLMVEYRYNGLGQRIAEHPDTNSSSNDGIADGEVDSNDPWFYLAVDTQGRRLATFRESDTYPKETFVYHQPGVGARGGSRGPAFSGGILARHRNASLSDPTNLATEAGSSTRAERMYYLSDHRANVVGLVDSGGNLIEQYRYSPSGVPFGLPRGDIAASGSVTWDDLEKMDDLVENSGYEYRADLNLDGVVDAEDYTVVDEGFGASTGRGKLSNAAVSSQFGPIQAEVFGVGLGLVGLRGGYAESLILAMPMTSMVGCHSMRVPGPDDWLLPAIISWCVWQNLSPECKAALEEFLRALGHTITTLPGWPNAFIPELHPNNPHQHCVWNCRMTVSWGEEFAREQSLRKEQLDILLSRLGIRLIQCGVWKYLPEAWRDFIGESAYSAGQPSDWHDNYTGRQCGLKIRKWHAPLLPPGSCEDCCTERGIKNGTPEGPGEDRPYAPGWPHRRPGEPMPTPNVGPKDDPCTMFPMPTEPTEPPPPPPYRPVQVPWQLP